MSDLDGRVAIITGAARGQGEAEARLLVANGASVVITDVLSDEARRGRRRPRRARHVPHPGRLVGCWAALPTSSSPNAGGPPRGGVDDVDLDAYRSAIDQNMLSTIGMCTTALPGMRERGWGRIVAITSVVVKQPAPYLVLSNTARAGLHGYLKTTALAVAPDGVTVNAVLPGAHATDRQKALSGDNLQPKGIPVGRFGEPDDFGDVVAFLCSTQAGSPNRPSPSMEAPTADSSDRRDHFVAKSQMS